LSATFRVGCTRMNLSHVEFLVEEALVNLRRNGLMTLAAIGTVALALAVFGGFGLILWRLEKLANSLPPKFAIDVFLKDNVSRHRTGNFQTQRTGVARVPEGTAAGDYRRTAV
jgi:cell division protein FtsX